MITLITGASGGIGRAIAKKFLEEGFSVHGFDTQDSPFAKESHNEPTDYHHYVVDVREPGSFPDLKPNIVINCAGVQNDGHDIDINLKGAINITEKYAIDNEDIISVLNIGSASGHTGSEFPEYAASKGGLMAYTKNVALRLAPRAICNSIDPGGVATELNRCVMDDEKMWSEIMEMTPLRRWAQPEEIAEWAYFVSAINKFMTGQNLLIDGGESGNNKFIWPDKM